jgi:hypothetical protein
MEAVKNSFVHVLLFACPKCRVPLASACASAERNLEVADGTVRAIDVVPRSKLEWIR